MLVPKHVSSRSSRGPEFRDPLPFSVSPFVRKYASYLDTSRFTYMQATDHVFIVGDRYNVLLDTDVGA